MRDEIVLKNLMRPTFFLFSAFALICSLLFFLYTLTVLQNQPNADDLLPVISSAGVILFSGWQIHRLINNSMRLETSDDGIIINDNIRRYVPWTNIKNIYIADAKLASVEIDNAELGDNKTLIYIEFDNSDQIYFDNLLHKIFFGWQQQLNEQFSSLGNRIPVNTYMVTDLSQETICMLLCRRWQRAMLMTREEK